MKDKVLVAYSSTHGSTEEVANEVAETLRRQGLAVDVSPTGQVRSLKEYKAVVLGLALYMFRWKRDGRSFLSRHRAALSNGLPLAIFTGGTLPPDGNEEVNEEHTIEKQVANELARFAWLKPASVEIIGGRFDPDNLRLPWKLLPALKKIPASDERDWQAIRGWAASLPECLNLTAR